MSQTSGAFPEQRFFLRERDGLSFHVGPPNDVTAVESFGKISHCASAQFSSDGSMLAIVSPNDVCLLDTKSGAEIRKFGIPSAVAVSFSPKGTYLQTYHRVAPGSSNQSQEKNLNVWDIASGAPVFQQFQKVFSKASWPSVQFSEDESVACRLVTNEVQFYDGKAFSRGVLDRLRVPGLRSVELAFSPGSHIAVYVPEIKGAPASIRLFETASVSQGQAVARRSFFRSSSVRFLWNRGSTGVLIIAHSDEDKTNQSYYGESSLHFLTSDGSYDGAVPLTKEGPIHDVQWSPSGKEFIVVHGFMPAAATLFDSKCKPLFDFGSGRRNIVRWSPKGRFLLLAGFGNLPGDMEFWDRNKLKILGQARAEWTVSCEWSPNGRYVLNATTAPRLNVDNGIRIFKYDGTLVYEKRYECLYQAEWRPAPDETYPDRPASPQSQKTQAVGTSSGMGSTASGVAKGALAAAVKPAAYRPPHVSSASSATLNALMSGADHKPHKITPAGKAVPPGGMEMSKSALKNKKRRDKEKQQKGSAEGEGVTCQAGNQGESATTADAGGITDRLAAMASPSAQDSSNVIESAGADVAKKIRAVQKKLRQIDELKKKAEDAGGLENLPPPLREKLAAESSLIIEMKNLQKQLP